jgi:pyridoxine 4-dehydrogenase
MIGARRRPRLADAIDALRITLTQSDPVAIKQAVPKGAVTGERDPAPAIVRFDSERPHRS